MSSPIAIVSCSSRSPPPRDSPFSIKVGVSVELPSGSYSPENLDHKSFFEFLLSSGEAYEDIPSDRFNIEACVVLPTGLISHPLTIFLPQLEGNRCWQNSCEQRRLPERHRHFRQCRIWNFLEGRVVHGARYQEAARERFPSTSRLWDRLQNEEGRLLHVRHFY